MPRHRISATGLRRAAFLAALSVTAQGCDEAMCSEPPPYPELQDVTQLLPESRRVRLTREEVVDACQGWVDCAGNTGISHREYAFNDNFLANCIGIIVRAAEAGRVIKRSNEDVRFFVDCISNAAGDCDRVLGCSTLNLVYDQRCSPSGCPRGDPAVTCNGSVATIETETGVVERDCARSRRACNADSVSGCDDALRFACTQPQLENRVEDCSLDGWWCEGDVIMGCSTGSARVGDCAVFGGTCQEAPAYSAACIYPGAPEPGCASVRSQERGMDADGEFQCVRGRKVYLDDRVE